MARKALTDEEKLAKKLVDSVNNLDIDLEEVGTIIGRTYRNVSVKRLLVIAESAEYAREDREKYWTMS